MPSLLEIPGNREKAIQIAWFIGRLKYKLQPQQKVVYETIKASPPEEIFCVVCSRGFGKTFIGSTLALETARREKDSNILIVSSTIKKLRTIVKPAFDTLLQDCPPDYLPKFNAQDSTYEFPKNVTIHLVAAEKGHIKDVRGIHKVSLVIIDEAAFFGEETSSYPLDYVVENIINPMFLRSDIKARIVMLTTPPDVPNHPFQKYFLKAQAKGCVATFDIYQSDIPKHRIDEEKSRCQDENAWRREYLCQWVVDESRLIMPEFKDEYIQQIPNDEYFHLYHKYSFLDTGVRDFTVNLFAHYDFKRAKLIIDDEVVLKNEEVRTDILAQRIKEKEKYLFGSMHTKEDRTIYRRIGDNSNLIILQDLSGIHGLPFLPTTKDELFAMVNEVRLWLNAGRIIVHPRCSYLIGCLKYGIWDKNKKEFARSSAYGHFDALAALCYGVRNIDTNTNPIPADFGLSLDKHNLPNGKIESDKYRMMREALKMPLPRTTTDDWRKPFWRPASA